jgi:hypothetical protein
MSTSPAFVACSTRGAPIHGVGIQGHIWGEDILANPGVLKERLDKVAALGLPIWITEFDVANDNETSCADKLELVYRTAYSHPAVKGIMSGSSGREIPGAVPTRACRIATGRSTRRASGMKP